MKFSSLYAAAALLGAPTDVRSPDATPTAAPSSDQLTYPVQIEVDISGLLEQQEQRYAEESGSRVHEELRDHLLETYRVVVDTGAPGSATIRVRLAFIDYKASQYRIAIEIERPDGDNPPPLEYQCDGCLDEELIDGVIERAPTLVSSLERQQQAPPPQDSGKPPPDDTTPIEAPRRNVLVAGYVTAGIGVAALAGGVVALTRPIRPIAASLYTSRNWRPLGVGLAVGGGATLATGVTLLVLEYTRCKRHGTCAPQDDHAATAIAPWFGPAAAGVGLSRRF